MHGGSFNKIKHLDHLKENGEIVNIHTQSASRKSHDLDIKMLQAKKQQAEIRR